MADIHDSYMQAMWHYNRSMDLLVEGIDTLDTDLLDLATSEIEMGTMFIYEAAELTNDFMAAHSL